MVCEDLDHGTLVRGNPHLLFLSVAQPSSSTDTVTCTTLVGKSTFWLGRKGLKRPILGRGSGRWPGHMEGAGKGLMTSKCQKEVEEGGGPD